LGEVLYTIFHCCRPREVIIENGTRVKKGGKKIKIKTNRNKTNKLKNRITNNGSFLFWQGLHKLVSQFVFH
jgi:hypothetical protein